MKKLIFSTFAAALFSLGLTAQTAYLEKWPNGTVKTEGFVIGDAAVKPTDPKDVQARKLSAVIRDGKWSAYYENGKLRSEEHYIKGSMTGLWKSYYDNGVQESQIDFNSGKAIFFHKDGTKHSEGGMRDGMIHTGTWTAYHLNGAKNYEGSYDNEGKKTGTWKWYDDKGTPVSEQVFENGNILTTKTLSK